MRSISGLSRGFSTCCLRFTNGVATIHAKLASGWLAGLYREGVEPSGSRRKVSDYILVPLSWIFPDATSVASQSATFDHMAPQQKCMLLAWIPVAEFHKRRQSVDLRAKTDRVLSRRNSSRQ